MKTLKKWDIVRMISEKINHRYPQMEIYYIIKQLGPCMEEVLRDGNKLIIGDTFSLQPEYKKERRVGNFGKEPVIVPGHYTPKFKAYHRLKEACKEYEEHLENGSLDKEESK